MSDSNIQSLGSVVGAHGEVGIHGYVAPGFERVVDVFRDNFARYREIGAACSAFVDGVPVVDIWGGWRTLEDKAPWHADTMVLVMSTTKGLAGLVLAQLHSDQVLDYDRPVAGYWPEFGSGGKSAITVRQLLAHQAGLAAIDTPLTLDLMGDPDRLDKMLENEQPNWEPGTRHGYHATTLGFFQNALARRADSKSRSIGTLLRNRLASEVGLDLHIGLPVSIGADRLAAVEVSRDWAALFRLLPLKAIAASFNPKGIVYRVSTNPRLKSLAEVSTRPYLALELPSFGGVVTPRALANAYSLFAAGGQKLGISPKTIRELEASAIAPSGGDIDMFYGIPMAYALGFSKPSPAFPFGSDDRAYGTAGAGGSQAFADPATGLGFAYAPNRLNLGTIDEIRARRLREAVYACLARDQPGAAHG